MTRWARTRVRRLHRTTVLVLVLTVVGTTVGTFFTRDLVQQSEHRLLQQKAGAAAIIMSGLLGQSYAPAVQALGAAVKPDGTVDQTTFAMTSAALRAPEATSASQQGGLGASGAALIDPATGQVAASAGTLRIDPRSTTDLTGLAQAAKVASTDPGHAAFAGLHGAGPSRTLSLVAPAGAHLVSYLELPFAGTIDVGSLESAPQYNQAFGGLDFAIYYGNATTGQLLWTNEGVHGLDGYVARVFVGLTSTSGFESTAYDAGKRPLMIALEARQPLTGQFSHRFPWLMLAFGLLTGMAVMVLTEVTQRRKDDALALVRQLEAHNAEVQEAVNRREQAEEQLRQAQRLEAIGQLAGGIAHDFNNLLAIIFSYTGFLRNAGQGQPWSEDVQEIDKAAHRAAELTQQLLMFSRREEQRSSVVDLRALVSDRFRLLRRTLSEDIDVRLELPTGPVLVRADQGELDQVLMNLVVNARDAMPSGGMLVLALTEVGGDVEFRVRDTGTGMSPEVQEHAFEPFFTTKGVGRGTGLGLATVYGIATRWGGTVLLRSAPNEGTEVVVRLPRTDDAPEPPLPLPAVAGFPCTPRAVTVLLVEDEEGVRRANARILTEAGFSVVVASTGPEAVALFDHHQIGALVSDVVMPGGLSGPELVEQLRLQRPGLPAVLVSGHSRDHLTRAGAVPQDVQLVRKPFAAQTLIDATQHCLNAEGARS